MKILIIWLLDVDIVGLPLASWLGIFIATLIALLGWLLKNAYNKLIITNTEVEKRLDELEREISNAKDKIVKERNRSDQEMRNMDRTIQNITDKIGDKLDALKDKINEIRSQ